MRFSKMHGAGNDFIVVDGIAVVYCECDLCDFLSGIFKDYRELLIREDIVTVGCKLLNIVTAKR